MSLNMETLILSWAEDKGILTSGTIEGQLRKLEEEFQELKDAIEEDNLEEIADALGDMQVVQIILAEMFQLSAYGCLTDAYGVISRRKGKMVDGVFVKDEEAA